MTPYHNVGLSHASQSWSRELFIDYCVLRCLVRRLEDPTQYIKSPWIRPEDVHHYEAIGYRSFKILERDAPTQTLVRRVRAYQERVFDGNLLDLVQCWGYKDSRSKGQPARGKFWELKEFFRPRALRPLRLLPLKELAELQGMLYSAKESGVRIDNRALDGFLERFVREDCSLDDCRRCGYCDEYAGRAVTIDEWYRSRCLELARGILNDLASGDMWGVGR
jgi:collagenase-like PrtC family protease